MGRSAMPHGRSLVYNSRAHTFATLSPFLSLSFLVATFSLPATAVEFVQDPGEHLTCPPSILVTILFTGSTNACKIFF
jgi:hypothetical protein